MTMLLFATHNLRLRANTATTAPTADELLVLADGSVVNTTTGEVTTENPPSATDLTKTDLELKSSTLWWPTASGPWAISSSYNSP